MTSLTKPLMTSALGFSALLTLTAHAALGPGGGVAAVSDYTSSPPQIVEGADPFLMINLSVELTQQAESFTDATQTYANGTYCPGRDIDGRGACYTGAETYIGYFDPNKCYDYDTTGGNTVRVQRPQGPFGASDTFDAHHFRPAGPTDSNHECNLKFSGNFLNWATMSALDQFRAAMTGGARIYDTAGSSAKTMLARAFRFDSWGFVDKHIDRTGVNAVRRNISNTVVETIPFYTNPRRVTPFNVDKLYVVNNFGGTSGHRARFYNSSWTRLEINEQDNYNIIVEVCNPVIGLESNCVEYTDGTSTWYKPEGLLQQNALKMRYALTSYTGRDGNAIHGGVLRANAKYIGYYRPTEEGGVEINPNAETNSQGLIVPNPDGFPLATDTIPNTNTQYNNGIVNSGIINYINQFALAAGRYKSNDPAAELYYEGLRYIMGLGPTPSFSSGLTNTEKDGYPVINQAIGSTSQFAWTDPVTNSCQANFALYVGDQFAHQDSCLPGINSPGNSATCSLNGNAPPSALNALSLTNTVGSHEGLGGDLGTIDRGRGDGFWIAGLAYWANTNDVRPTITGTQTVKSFFVDTQEYRPPTNPAPMRQENQLWLAAKYGGFEDSGNELNAITPRIRPDLLSEWTSDTGPNPDPDSYTLASQPANMVAGLTRVFSDVLENSASASAAAVVANASRGTGAVYQAIYEPRLTDGGTVVTWTGMLRGLFIDSQARIREDSNSNAQLDSGDTDRVIEFVRNEADDITYAQRRLPSSNAAVGDQIPIRDISPIWDARKRLAEISNVTSQRNYTESAATGRYIITGIDGSSGSGNTLQLEDGDGIVDSGEVQPFIASTFESFDSTNSAADFARLLGADSNSGANDGEVQQYARDLVNYIRGQDRDGWRNRQINIYSDITNETLRLGDIVHSAPLVVGAPNGDYDRLHGDNTYRAFKQQYGNRRQVVYAGANDGMLHAFNAGFFNNSTQTFELTGNSSDTAHPLGSELWAYVPYNLLPHLQWLKEPEYPHVYYVDGAPQAFDVNIFDPSDANYPGGWGTILVVGFRFGGGEITIDVDSDLDGAGLRTMRSAYLIFDITNPEEPPTLLAEISHPQLGFTTSVPTVVKRRVPSSDGSFAPPLPVTNNQWFLVFGSGPAGSTTATKRNALVNGISDQVAKAFVFNLSLNELTLEDYDSSAEGDQPLDISGQDNGFVGAMVAKDWDRDFIDEVIYFGTVSGSVSDPTGDLIRMLMPSGYSGTPTFETLLTNNGNGQPFFAPPFPTKDASGQPWVYAGSGRFLTDADILSSKEMTYYGIKESLNEGSVDLDNPISKGDMVDTTGIQVFSDSTVLNSDGNALSISTASLSSTAVGTFAELVRTIRQTDGWYFNFNPDSARFVDRTLSTGSSLIFLDYVPSGESCEPAGSSNLYAVNMLTGTASPFAALGPENDPTTPANMSVSMGEGQYFLSGLHTAEDGSTTVLITGSSADLSAIPLGGTPTVSGRMSWREIPLN